VTSLKASIAGEVDKQFAADYVVVSEGFGPGFSPQLNLQLKELPEVDSTSALRFNQAQIDGSVKSIIAVEPDTITSVFNFGRVSGDFTALSGDGIAVSEDSAESNNLALGSVVHAVFVNTAKDLTVDAIYERNTVAGNYVIGLPTYEAGYNEQFDMVVMVKSKGPTRSGPRRGREAAGVVPLGENPEPEGVQGQSGRSDQRPRPLRLRTARPGHHRGAHRHRHHARALGARAHA
jgi:putative ABC transport system permease protein